MIRRCCWAGLALLAMLAIAAPCLAEDPSGPLPGRGAVGGLIGASYFFADADYSNGALPRFAFSGNLRYVMTPRWRWQLSPGFTWAAYANDSRMPFVEPRYPAATTKADILTQLVPISAQLQFVTQHGPWYLHYGAGPGLYRVMVQNQRDVILDARTYTPHRGMYLGTTAQLGIERFFKALPNTDFEISLAWHWIFAEREDQFPSGFNSFLGAGEVRLGANYYFNLARGKRKAPDLPRSGKR